MNIFNNHTKLTYSTAIQNFNSTGLTCRKNKKCRYLTKRRCQNVVCPTSPKKPNNNNKARKNTPETRMAISQQRILINIPDHSLTSCFNSTHVHTSLRQTCILLNRILKQAVKITCRNGTHAPNISSSNH